MATTTLTSGSSWTCLTGVYMLTVEVWAGGGGGGRATGYPACGGGGGGGAYAKKVFASVPGTAYSYSIGSGGASNSDGNDTYWINASTLLAKKGLKGGEATSNNSNGAGGAGGAIIDCIGDVKYRGGNGYTGVYATPRSGSGGGGAGSSGDGQDATDSAGGSATADNGGAGANGRTTAGTGGTGSSYGGGGAGGYASTSTDRAGGAGANGVIRLTYTQITNGYYIEKKIGAGDYLPLTVIDGLGTTTYEDASTFENGTTYYYRVKRIEEGYESDWSSIASVEYVESSNMDIKINIGGNLKTVSAIKINIGGTLKTVSAIKVNIGGSLKDV